MRSVGLKGCVFMHRLPSLTKYDCSTGNQLAECSRTKRSPPTSGRFAGLFAAHFAVRTRENSPQLDAQIEGWTEFGIYSRRSSRSGLPRGMRKLQYVVHACHTLLQNSACSVCLEVAALLHPRVRFACMSSSAQLNLQHRLCARPACAHQSGAVGRGLH